MKRARIAVASALVILVTEGQTELPGCGPYFEQAVFSFERYPLPVEEYAAGRLGVVEPTLWRKFLFTAYRYFTNAPLTDIEREAVVGGTRKESTAPEQLWLDARARIEGVDRKGYPDVYRRVPGGQYQSYLNCTADAFRTSVETLEARSRELGRSHPALRKWVEAQDVVFSNCGGGSGVPSEPEPDLPAALRFDRAYQIAAAHFYAERFDEAEARFRAIAAEPGSPWASTAALLVARTLVRRGTLVAGAGKNDAEMLGRADRELRAILDDPRRAALHPSARRLLGFTAAAARPAARLAELSAELVRPSGDGDVRQRVIDYQLLMDRVEAGSIPRAEARAAGGMTDWILTFQASGPEPLTRVLSRWRETKSLPWLVAALTKIPAGHPEAPVLVSAAERVPADSPAFATLAYHRVRLLDAGGDSVGARNLLDDVLRRRDAFTESAVNRFLQERFKLAVDFDEFMRFAPRAPVGVTEFDERMARPERRDLLFDKDSVRVFNRGLPLVMLSRASASNSIPESLRAQLAVAAWTRAVLLEKDDVARSLSERLRSIEPAITPYLNRYLAAPTDQERSFAAGYLLLHMPGLRPYVQSGIPHRDKLTGIDNLRENWWCRIETEAEHLPFYSRWDSARIESKSAIPQHASFLDPAGRAAFEREWAKLTALDTAPNHLASIVVPWAKAHPDDRRVPEALHLVVRATRFGCTDKKTTEYSRAAFQLLHRRYPGSPWARRTKYWY